MYEESHLTLFLWAELNQKLVSYYFKHFLKFASSKLCQVNCQVNRRNDYQVICTSTTVQYQSQNSKTNNNMIKHCSI